ncbi:hypothetical protein NDU88_005831 [Pleurodeles waltl]|uniref:Uncharacterized protein n=1 Tax=Pleurodeles waltl TaxID=8319 RepID=A0AAV7WCX7_PLEWA|nr:hypothetical protein NDU88_005831 [Pleurodeles waltl]
MCEGSSPTRTDGGLGWAAGWACATLELRRSRRAASHVHLRWKAGRVSTSRVTDQAVVCGAVLEPDDHGKTSAGRGRRLSPSKAMYKYVVERHITVLKGVEGVRKVIAYVCGVAMTNDLLLKLIGNIPKK